MNETTQTTDSETNALEDLIEDRYLDSVLYHNQETISLADIIKKHGIGL